MKQTSNQAHKLTHELTRLLTTLPLAGLLALAACSAKVTSSGGDAPPADRPVQDTTVAGPNLDGEWTLKCSVESILEKGGYVDRGQVVHRSIKGLNIEEKTSIYSDSACTKPLRDEVKKGSFSFTEKRAGDVYMISYNFSHDKEVSVAFGSVKIVGDSLFTGDLQGNMGSEFRRDGAAPAAANSPSAPAAPAANLSCAARKLEMTSISDEAETDLYSAYRGYRPSTTTLRSKISAFESKYAALRCDGEQTTSSFVDSMLAQANQIDSLQ